VFVGYQAEGTIGRRIQRGAKEIPMNVGGNIVSLPVEMNVETCDGFSGHSDRRQLVGFINNMSPRPERVVFGHGEESKCVDLCSTIHKRLNMNTAAPFNLETIRFV
ncbi:MAG TPA: beta-CASP ribonuclease aCPSF1, partial [Thermoplasmata archaeon]|nr:beta-CASP ribonuclease aCPSF1 [Thermoplasmata archaeon]